MLLINPALNPEVQGGAPTSSEVTQINGFRDELTYLVDPTSRVQTPEELAALTMLVAEYLRYILRFEVSLGVGTRVSMWRRAVHPDFGDPTEIFRFSKQIEPSGDEFTTHIGAAVFFKDTPGQERLKIIHCKTIQKPKENILTALHTDQIAMPFGTRALKMLHAEEPPISSDSATSSPPNEPKKSFSPFQPFGKSCSLTEQEIFGYHDILARIIDFGILTQTPNQIELLYTK